MSVESRLKRLALFTLPLLGVAFGLFFVINGSLLGLIALLLGGGVLIAVASGRVGLPRSHTDSTGVAASPGQTESIAETQVNPVTTTANEISPASQLSDGSSSATTHEGVRRWSAWLPLAAAFAFGLVGGVLLDRVLLSSQSAAQLPAPALPSASLFSPLASPIAAGVTGAANDGMVSETIQVNGEALVVTHSQLDMGRAADIFDGRFETLMRGSGANPFVFEVRYSQPRDASAVVLSLASMDDYEIKVIATTTEGEAITLIKAGQERLVDPSLEFTLPDGPRKIQAVRAEILDRRPPPQEGFHTHVRDFILK